MIHMCVYMKKFTILFFSVHDHVYSWMLLVAALLAHLLVFMGTQGVGDARRATEVLCGHRAHHGARVEDVRGWNCRHVAGIYVLARVPVLLLVLELVVLVMALALVLALVKYISYCTPWACNSSQ